jgi:transposase
LSFIDIDNFNNIKQLVAFLGLNPKHRQSGKSINGYSRISKTGNSNLRKTLYFPAIVAKKHNPIIKVFCERLKATGKPPMIIICAAMRKLVHIIYGVLKSGKSFDAALANI